MKCEPARTGPCKRCRNNKIECVFRPRANARQSTSILPPRSAEGTDATSSEVLDRLAVIESVLGITRNIAFKDSAANTLHSNSPIGAANIDGHEVETDQALEGLWQTTAILQQHTAPNQSNLWSRPVVSQLWLS
jgi:hypothetical protein